MREFLKDIAQIATMLVVMAVLVIAAFLWWRHENTANLLAKTQETAGKAVVGQAQATAALDAQHVIVSGEAHQALDINLHQANTNAILTARGADAPLDPALIAAANAGLCRYQTDAADPGCAGLRGVAPPELPPAGPVSGVVRPE